MVIENFSRKEYKFPMTYDDMDRMLDDLAPYVEKDKHADEHGYYTISSIYMDNRNWQCFYETINKDLYRQKVRLRVYDTVTNESPSYFEVKSKHRGNVLKRRARMKLADAVAFMNACVNGEDPDVTSYESSNEQILNEVKRVIVTKNLKAVNVVSYDRLALFWDKDPSLRITFDVNIRTRDYDLDLTKGSEGRHVNPDNIAILEVKSNKNFPYWLVKILAKYNYRNQTFSKYCSHFLSQDLEPFDLIKNEEIV